MMVAVGAGAATESSVTATVTAQNISVSVSDGSVVYGTLAVNTSKDTTPTGVHNTQVATNDGNITESLNIKGANSTSAGAGWTLADSAGSEQYKHEFCTSGAGSSDPCDTTPSYTVLTTDYQSLATSVGTSGTQRFDLQITTPTATTDFNEQTVTVTVQAVAS